MFKYSFVSLLYKGTKLITNQKTKIMRKEMFNLLTANLDLWFCHIIDSDTLIERVTKPFMDISEEQESEVYDIIASYQRDYDNVECEDEGLSWEQERELEDIVIKCAEEVIEYLGVQ